jgi:hypothetical protein
LDAIRSMSLDSVKFELEAEMFAVSVRNHLRIKELPIIYLPREGESKLVPINSGFMIFRKLLQRRWVGANTQDKFTGDPDLDLHRINNSVRPKQET